jgi:DNA repair protein RAD51
MGSMVLTISYGIYGYNYCFADAGGWVDDWGKVRKVATWTWTVTDGGLSFSLVIIDSCTSLYRHEYTALELHDRQTHLNRFLRTLQEIAHEVCNFFLVRGLKPLYWPLLEFLAAIVVTNEVKCNPNADPADQEEPIGGNIMAHSSTIRWDSLFIPTTVRWYIYSLHLKKAQQSKRSCTVYESPCLPMNQTHFMILPSGIGDEQTV